jgi:hypothetical protein
MTKQFTSNKTIMDKSLQNKAIKIQGKSYVLVADRILFFNAEYPNGSIKTEYTEQDDRVTFRATVIPDATKPERIFIAHSQAVWGVGMVNKTSALENAETSAVGRALAMMGIGVIESIASVDEIHKSKQTENIQDNLGLCAKCGATNKRSKTGNNYCSKLCWKNPPKKFNTPNEQKFSDELDNIPVIQQNENEVQGITYGEHLEDNN